MGQCPLLMTYRYSFPFLSSPLSPQCKHVSFSGRKKKKYSVILSFTSIKIQHERGIIFSDLSLTWFLTISYFILHSLLYICPWIKCHLLVTFWTMPVIVTLSNLFLQTYSLVLTFTLFSVFLLGTFTYSNSFSVSKLMVSSYNISFKKVVSSNIGNNYIFICFSNCLTSNHKYN